VDTTRFEERQLADRAEPFDVGHIFLALLVIALVLRVFAEGDINVHRIQGAVAAYLVLRCNVGGML
jgi:hypothetical protein